MASFDQAIRIDGNYVDAWYNKGLALDKLDKYTEAVASFDQAIRIDGNYVDAWSNRGLSFYSLGKYVENCLDEIASNS